MVKNLPANAGDKRDWVLSLGQEDSPRGGNGNNHSSILAWRIPWTGDLGRLQSMGSQRVRHDGNNTTHATLEKIHKRRPCQGHGGDNFNQYL